MSQINSSDALRQMSQTTYAAADILTLKTMLSLTYGPFPMLFSSPVAMTPGQADVVITDVVTVPGWQGSGDTFPGGVAMGYVNCFNGRGMVSRGSSAAPQSIMVVKAGGAVQQVLKTGTSK